MTRDAPKYHGGYGKCGGHGKVWVDRRKALAIAKANGQYRPSVPLSELYSENLW